MKILSADNMIKKRRREDGRIYLVIIYCKQNITTVNEIKAFFRWILGYENIWSKVNISLRHEELKDSIKEKLYGSLKQNKKMKISSCYDKQISSCTLYLGTKLNHIF